MTVSGLIITLSADASLAQEAVKVLRNTSEITVAAAHGRWLPAAVETDTEEEGRRTHDWIQGLTGVEFVEVVYVGFDSSPGPLSPPTTTRNPTPETGHAGNPDLGQGAMPPIGGKE